MSISIDSIFLNLLEKAVSQDQNDQATIAGRHMAEMLRGLNAQPALSGAHGLAGFIPGQLSFATREKVHGLAIDSIDTGGRTITIGDGSLMANGGAESATALDSTYRVGLHITPLAVPIPIPASDLFWNVLEAQVFQDTPVQASRDILINPVTNTFAPQLVDKQLLKRVQFRVRIGTATELPAVDAAWTPLYAFRVPLAGSQMPLGEEIVDLRQPASVSALPRSGAPDEFSTVSYSVLSRALVTQTTVSAPVAFQVRFRFAAVIDGQLCFAYVAGGTGGGVSFVDAADFVERGVTLNVDGWWYWYLAPSPYGAGALPSAANLYTWRTGADRVVQNCILVLSQTEPRRNGLNGAALLLPEPFNTTSIPVSQAVCVAAILAEGVPATTWAPTRISSNGVAKMAGAPSALDLSGVATRATEQVLVDAGPAGISTQVDTMVGMTVLSVAPGGAGLVVAIAGSNGLATTAETLPGVSGHGRVHFDPEIQDNFDVLAVPVEDAGGDVTIRFESRDPKGIGVGGTSGATLSTLFNATSRAGVKVVGFKL